MSLEQIILLKKITNQLSSLIFLNGIIATELIKITENSAAIRRGEEFLTKSTCLVEHNQLNKEIIETIKLFLDKPENIKNLEKHVLKHVD